jgi:hypothetical protein
MINPAWRLGIDSRPGLNYQITRMKTGIPESQLDPKRMAAFSDKRASPSALLKHFFQSKSASDLFPDFV